MGQVELSEYAGLYSKKEVEDMVSVWTTGQVAICGMSIGTAGNKFEQDWIKAAIFDALNHPEKFNSKNDTFGALMVLKSKIQGGNVHVLKSEYGVPPRFEYRNSRGVNAVVDVNHESKVVFHLTACEVLDVICDLNKNRSIKQIFNSYDFYHKNVSLESLKFFKDAYSNGELNKVVKYICSKSNDIGGFKDHGVGVVRNRLTSQYLFDARRK